MELSALRIFRTVVDAGGVTRAAERLHRVQSNVTTRVRQLEEELGVELFIREGKRLRLAPTGRVLYDYAERILDLAEEARAAVRDDAPRGTLRLGAMDSTAAVRLPGPLARYAERYPDVRIELSTGNPTELSAALLAGTVDAALIAEPVAAGPFDTLEAFVEEPVIVTARGHPPPEREAPRTMIVFEHGCPHRKRLEEWYADMEAVPERIVELASYHAMLASVVAGMGAALLPRSVLDTFPESGKLAVHALKPGRDRIRTLLAWRKGAPAPNVAALAEILGAEILGAEILGAEILGTAAQES